MKISSSISLTSLVVLCLSLSACNSAFSYFNKNQAHNTQDTETTYSAPVAKVKMEENLSTPGVSSSTVERLAKKNQCEPQGAVNLVTEKGPIEIYKTTCQDGTIFTARCELRQCKATPN